jgi:hypothetical protein
MRRKFSSSSLARSPQMAGANMRNSMAAARKVSANKAPVGAGQLKTPQMARSTGPGGLTRLSKKAPVGTPQKAFSPAPPAIKKRVANAKPTGMRGAPQGAATSRAPSMKKTLANDRLKNAYARLMSKSKRRT